MVQAGLIQRCVDYDLGRHMLAIEYTEKCSPLLTLFNESLCLSQVIPLEMSMLKKPCFCDVNVTREMFAFDDTTLKITAELPSLFDSVILTVSASSSAACICQINIFKALLVNANNFSEYHNELYLPLNYCSPRGLCTSVL